MKPCSSHEGITTEYCEVQNLVCHNSRYGNTYSYDAIVCSHCGENVEQYLNSSIEDKAVDIAIDAQEWGKEWGNEY